MIMDGVCMFTKHVCMFIDNVYILLTMFTCLWTGVNVSLPFFTKGDKIVVASTDSDWRHAELRTLIPCVTCTSRQVRVNGKLEVLKRGCVHPYLCIHAQKIL